MPLALAGRAAVLFLLPNDSNGVMVVLRGRVVVANLAEENLRLPRLPLKVALVPLEVVVKGPGEEPFRWLLMLIEGWRGERRHGRVGNNKNSLSLAC